MRREASCGPRPRSTRIHRDAALPCLAPRTPYLLSHFRTFALSTADIDFVVHVATRERLAPVFEALGLTRKDRHWIIEDLYVEVPGTWVEDPFEPFELGPYRLQVVRKEIVLGQRVIGFRYWKTWAYGLQAISMIRAFGNTLDQGVLRDFLRRDQAEPAYDLLAELAASDKTFTEADLDRIWHSRYR